MIKKIIWILLSCLLLLSLIITSCDTSEKEAKVTEETKEVDKIVITESEEDVVEAADEGEDEEIVSPDEPKYGGTMTLTELLGASAFNPFDINHTMCGTVFIT